MPFTPTIESQAASRALERAIRRSEILRIRTIIGFAGALALFILARFFIMWDWSGIVGPISVALAMILYQGIVLYFATQQHQQERSLPLWFWHLNAAIECLMPTFGLINLANSGEVTPALGIIGPPVLGYAFFMTLQILSLRPSVVLVGAAVSAVGFSTLFVVVHVSYHLPFHDPVPVNVVVFYPFLLVLIGIGGAGVCRRIRSHVIAEIAHAHQRDAAESELGAASKIQRSLLPESPPEISGFEIAGWSRPAVHTGGDYYDWQSLPDGNVAVLLADVSGHGLGPALVAAFCRAYTRACLAHHDSLADAVSRVNSLVIDDLPEGWFITFVATILHPDENSVELYSAGHGPILHYLAASGEVEASGADAMPLGVGRDLGNTEARRIVLAAGDLLVLITDGFIEWPGPDGTRYGKERLQESLMQSAHKAPGDIVVAAIEDLESFAGNTPQEDDLTIVVIKRN